MKLWRSKFQKFKISKVAGFGLRVSGFGLRVAGCELRVAGFGLRVAGKIERMKKMYKITGDY